MEISAPKHGCPGFLACESLHVLILILVPQEHVTLQEDHGLHSPLPLHGPLVQLRVSCEGPLQVFLINPLRECRQERVFLFIPVEQDLLHGLHSDQAVQLALQA